MIETSKALETKRSPGRPKERKNAKRRSLYLEDDVWHRLEFCSFVQKKPISKIVEEASLSYIDSIDSLKHIDWNGDLYNIINA